MLAYADTAMELYNRRVDIHSSITFTEAVTVTAITRRLTYGYRHIHLKA